jgi:O-antigen/teichoic acid export membrane protein
MGVISAAIWPELSIALGSRNLELARKIHKNALAYSFWLSFVIILLLLFFGQYIIQIWTHNLITFDAHLFWILLFGVFLNSIYNASTVVGISINKFNTIAMTYLIVTAISFITSLFLVRYFGLDGAGISLLLIEFTMFFSVFKRSLLVLEENSSSIIKAVLVFPVNRINKLRMQLRIY